MVQHRAKSHAGLKAKFQKHENKCVHRSRYDYNKSMDNRPLVIVKMFWADLCPEEEAVWYDVLIIEERRDHGPYRKNLTRHTRSNNSTRVRSAKL